MSTGTLARMKCNHDPRLTPASCTDCMDEGIFLPTAARRARTGQHAAAGNYALKNDCSVQAIINTIGATYSEAAKALTAAGWVPGTGATERQIQAAVTALGFELRRSPLSLDQATRDGGTFFVVGFRGRKGHAWTIENGKHLNSIGWERPGRTTLRCALYEVA